MLVSWPTQISTWSEITPAQKLQIFNMFSQFWVTEFQSITPAQFFAGTSNSPVYSSSSPGSFSGDMSFALAALRYSGVDLNLLNQMVTWSDTAWPSHNFANDLNASCSVQNYGQI